MENVLINKTKDEENNMYKKLDMNLSTFEKTDFKDLLSAFAQKYSYKSYSCTPYEKLTADYYEPTEKMMNALAKKYPYSAVDILFPEEEMEDKIRWYWKPNYSLNAKKALYYKLYSEMPQLEQVIKAGYDKVIREAIDCNYYRSSYDMTSASFLSDLKRNFKPGTNIKDICKIPSFAYEYFKNISTLNEWNEMRIVVQKYLTTKEQFDAYVTLNNRFPGSMASMMKKAKPLLNSGYYTPEQLLNYLNRVDLYQAIYPEEALAIIQDYISMCKQIGAEPDVNTNSLKREHDVMQRNFWSMRQEIDEKKFASKADSFKKFEFSTKSYSIIAPKAAKDVINEGKMQRNCVGSYVNSIISGRSIILFLRETKSIDKSLVTIEISPKDFSIRQKYMACNKPITNKNILNFIEKWKKYLDTLK